MLEELLKYIISFFKLDDRNFPTDLISGFFCLSGSLNITENKQLLTDLQIATVQKLSNALQAG